MDILREAAAWLATPSPPGWVAARASQEHRPLALLTPAACYASS